jgi:hypothetical protein
MVVSFDLLLLNIPREVITKELWDNLGTLYQDKSMVNKIFLRNRL